MIAFSVRGLIKRSITFGTILAGADATLQTLEQWKSQQKDIDWKSLKRHACVGGGVIGPVLYTYYSLLDHKLPGISGRVVAFKVACDVIFANVIYYCLFYYCLR